jgi:hypothetical protein
VLTAARPLLHLDPDVALARRRADGHLVAQALAEAPDKQFFVVVRARDAEPAGAPDGGGDDGADASSLGSAPSWLPSWQPPPSELQSTYSAVPAQVRAPLRCHVARIRFTLAE